MLLDTAQSPNYFFLLAIGLAVASIFTLPLFMEAVRRWVWQSSVGENPLRYGLALLTILLSFAAGAGYLAGLFPEISTCSSSFSSSFSITTTTTTTIQNGNASAVSTPEVIFEASTGAGMSGDCVQPEPNALSRERWLRMLLPPMSRTSICLSEEAVCTSLNNLFVSDVYPANRQDAYLSLWAMSLAAGGISLYMTAYLLRDARKRKNAESSES